MIIKRSERFAQLSDFIRHRMRMSHIYQPVMLKALLENGGSCSVQQIAKDILAHDQSQIEYYEKVTTGMVGRVLTRHKLVKKNNKEFILSGFDDLSASEIEELVSQCEAKLEEYVEKRGQQIWEHRRKSAGYIPGTLRYEILKKAKFRCELCGVPADEKALEVDHIIPRNHGGTDDLSNLQALCYSCNAMKRDLDDTDFREVRLSYEHREPGCPFCDHDALDLIDQNSLAMTILDKFPVTPLHTLVIPKRHTDSYFELGRPELNACNELLQEAKNRILEQDSDVRGFNIGINQGHAAGQTVFHCHIHLVPRRKGDVANPRGGIRHIIHGKGDY